MTTEKAKLFLVNGALGAGKTSFINHFLARPELARARVIENEFANIGVDSSQLQCEQSRVITIAGVCICCSTGGELVSALNDFAATSDDPVVIEATGTADSVQLIERLMTGGALTRYQLAAAYYILDAAELMAGSLQEGIDQHLAEMKLADAVFVSKTDLISPTQLKRLRMALWYAGIDNPIILDHGQPEAADYPLADSQIVARAYDVKPVHHHHEHHPGHEHHHGDADDCCDDELEYVVINTTNLAMTADQLKSAWDRLRYARGLLRLKGDFLDPAGQQLHVEATPSQIVIGGAPNLAAPLALVFIGQETDDITAELLVG